MRREAWKPEFYDFQKSPDGHDCLEKTYYYTKYSGIFGSWFIYLRQYVTFNIHGFLYFEFFH